jgi:hypothetical protein
MEALAFAFRKLCTLLSSRKARAWEKWWVVGKSLDGVDVNCERVCADADEVNEVQYLLQVQQVGYFNLGAGGEWPRSMCNDEAGLRAVKRVRWPAASKLRTLAGARQVAWSCKQVTPETGIEVPEGLKKQQPRMPCVWLLYFGLWSSCVVPAARQEQE